MVEYPVSNCMRHRQVVFGVAVFLCLVLVAVGCEYDTQDVVAPAPVEVTEPSLPDVSDNQSWLVPSMPGMWIGHPNVEGNADAVPGVVVIEPPCVYVVEVAGDGEVERAALELTYPEFRLDHLTETLWYNDIALVTGDRVITNGPSPANDDYLFWNRCTAQNWNYVNGLTPLNCEKPGTKWERSYCEFHEEFFEGLSFSDCETPASDELSGLCQQIENATRIQDRGVPPPADSLPLPELHDMFPYHPDLELELTRLIGGDLHRWLRQVGHNGR